MHRKVAAALVAGLAFVAASCGGTESLTRAQLVNRIETACRQAQQRTEKAGRSNARGAESFFAAVLAGQRALVERIEGLEPPDELSDEVDTLSSGLTERSDLIAEVADAPRDEQERAMAAAEARVARATRDVQGALRSLGVEACG